MEKKYFKYNKDDILEILTETLAIACGFDTFNSKSDLIIDNGKIFFIGAIGKLEDDGINKADLTKLYKEMEYNGTHEARGCYSVEDWVKINDVISKRGTL